MRRHGHQPSHRRNRFTINPIFRTLTMVPSVRIPKTIPQARCRSLGMRRRHQGCFGGGSVPVNRRICGSMRNEEYDTMALFQSLVYDKVLINTYRSSAVSMSFLLRFILPNRIILKRNSSKKCGFEKRRYHIHNSYDETTRIGNEDCSMVLLPQVVLEVIT
jgi:hypothetical protein